MNWKSTNATKRTENEQQKPESTVAIKAREERISELNGIIEKCKEGIVETEAEIARLVNAEHEATRIYSAEVLKVVEDNPDTSVRGQIDLAYKTSHRGLKQARESLEKMHLLKGNYALKMRKANEQLAGIKEEIRTEALDAKVKNLFGKVKGWVKSYNAAQSNFDILRQTVMAMPEYSKYRDRIDALKLPGAFHVVADSHLRNMETLSQDRLAIRLSELYRGGDPYSMPADLKIDFDFTRDSDQPLIRDTFGNDSVSLGFIDDSDQKAMNAL